MMRCDRVMDGMDITTLGMKVEWLVQNLYCHCTVWRICLRTPRKATPILRPASKQEYIVRIEILQAATVVYLEWEIPKILHDLHPRGDSPRIFDSDQATYWNNRVLGKEIFNSS